ncbi:class C beta-lactamase-related serine hydrolase [Flavobacteriaceae bacterium AU392]|nr:class C beta-lactamase-related serine hydrolase [Flavobacteriaceae bacterium]RKM82797.1 class C beta-lactamase-related serine hydrolase [Flavobacteriaceae bacterium AU392]
MRSNYLFILIACLLLSCKNSSQSKSNNTLSNEIENLSFSTVDFTKVKGKIQNYSKQFNLHTDAYLSIIFNLDKPLIQSLQKLAPTLSEDELLSKGNFQFSYLVDGKLIHVENLGTGAGPKTRKTEKLRQVIPLVTPERINFWGWYMWQRFMKVNGGQDAFTEGNHTLSIEVRPYLNEDVLKVGSLLAKGNVAVEVPKIVIDENLVPVQKIKPNSGWEISKDNFDVNKIEALNRKIAEGRFNDINGIVVIKEGELLIEEYFNDATRDSLHDVRSVGKSFASTIMGIAIKEKFIKNENALLKDFYDLKSYKNYSAKKDAVTLKSLLTMSSGFLGDDDDYESPGTEDKMQSSDNWVKFTLDLPMHKDKIIGKDYNYFTAGTNLLGDIIHKSVPNGLASYADKKLFAPLGIANYKWFYTPQNIVYTGGGIRLRAIDFAKYGQLYKNKGLWNGKQILTKAWVEKSLAKQVSQDYGGIKGFHYGYLFWNRVYTVNGKNHEVSFSVGNGGNKILIFKDIPFVIVITASAYNQPGAHANVDKMVTDYILPAVLTEK